MKIRTIEFDDDENPATVTVTLTVMEAAVLTKLLGGMRGTDWDQRVPGGAEHGHKVYDSLTGGFFYRHWENGEDDVLRGS